MRESAFQSKRVSWLKICAIAVFRRSIFRPLPVSRHSERVCQRQRTSLPNSTIPATGITRRMRPELLHRDLLAAHSISNSLPRRFPVRRYLMLILPVVLLAAEPADDGKKDLEKLQGEWVMAALEIDGKAVPEAKLRDTTLTIKD